MELPLIVIPNLVRDPVFDSIEGLLFSAYSRSLTRDPVQENYGMTVLRLLVSAANPSK